VQHRCGVEGGHHVLRGQPVRTAAAHVSRPLTVSANRSASA
jgi:hypothetical protein